MLYFMVCVRIVQLVDGLAGVSGHEYKIRSSCGIPLLMSLEGEVQDIIWRVEVPPCQRTSQAYLVHFCTCFVFCILLNSFVDLKEIFRSFFSFI